MRVGTRFQRAKVEVIKRRTKLEEFGNQVFTGGVTAVPGRQEI